MLASLIPKLKLRFGGSAAQCGATSSAVEACQSMSLETYSEALNTARIEFSKYSPYADILVTNVTAINPVITLAQEPYAITGVYMKATDYFGDQNIINGPLPRSYMARWYADPALDRVDAIMSDYASPDVDFIVQHNKIRITSIFNSSAVVEVHVHRMREWNEIPEWAEPVILKLALISLIDTVTTSSNTLLRIPTPTGYFEFDGGRVMQNLRTKLEQEAYRTLEVGTTGLSQG